MFSNWTVSRWTGLCAGVAGAIVLAVVSVSAQTVKRDSVVTLRSQLMGGAGIGVTVRDLDDADVRREKLSSPAGAYISDLRPDGPAAKAGFKAGDVIVKFDGETVRSAKQLTRLVEETPDGREVEAVVFRGGERVTLKVAPQPSGFFTSRYVGAPNVLTQRKPALPSNVAGKTLTLTQPTVRYSLSQWMTGTPRLGASIQDLTEQLGDYFGTRTGVLVTEVNDGTPAKDAGLKAGDVITKINGLTVGSTADLRRRLTDVSGETTITVMRDRKEVTLKATIKDEPVSRTIIR
jgi:serine protease Do